MSLLPFPPPRSPTNCPISLKILLKENLSGSGSWVPETLETAFLSVLV